MTNIDQAIANITNQIHLAEDLANYNRGRQQALYKSSDPNKLELIREAADIVTRAEGRIAGLGFALEELRAITN